MLSAKKIKEHKNDIITYFLVGLFILLVTYYVSHSYKRLHINRYEKDLKTVGTKYVENINSTLSKISAIADIMSVSFVANKENTEFISHTKNILRTTMAKYPEIAMTNLVFNASNITYDDAFLDDSTHRYSVCLNREGDRISDMYASTDYYSEELQVKIEDLTQKTQTKVLIPENIIIQDRFATVFPVVSVIYKGKFFLGYLILYVDADINKHKKEFENYELFVFSEAGKLVSSNVRSAFLDDKLSKICSSCMSNYDGDYDVSISSKHITACFHKELSNSSTILNVCVRGHVKDIDLGYSLYVIWTLGIVCLIITFVTIYLIMKRYRARWTKTNLDIQKVLSGDISADRLLEFGAEEHKILKKSIVEIENTYINLVENNKKIIAQEFNSITPISSLNNKINSSNQELYNKFKEIHDQLSESTQQLAEIRLINKNLNIITELIQKNHSNVMLMMDLMIQKFVSLLDFEMGSVFFKTTENDTVYLEQIVSYAYSDKKKNKVRFKLGVSLVGACAAEKRIIHVKKIPKDYLKIVSGLGSTPPKNILLVPLLFEDNVLGVIELGSLHEILPSTIRFLEKVSTSISVVLSLTQLNEINATKFAQSERARKFIAEQNKTLQENLLELKAMQNQTNENFDLLNTKLEAVNHAFMVAEFNPKGELVNTNIKFNNSLQYSVSELQGKKIQDFVDESKIDKFYAVMKKLGAGNVFESFLDVKTSKRKYKKIYSIFSPALDHDGKVKKMFFFGIEI